MYNRVGKVFSLLAARPVRRFSGIFLCTGLCKRVGEKHFPYSRAGHPPAPLASFLGVPVCN